MGDVEEERAAERVLFGFGSQHALRDVAAAAGFGAGIPDAPPLDCDGDDKDSDGEIPVVGEVGQEAEVVEAARAAHVGELIDHAGEAADLRQSDREIGGGDNGGHLDEELDHIDHQDTPETGVRGEDDIEQSHGQQRFPARKAEEDGGDFAGGEVDGRHNDAVEEEAEVDGAEAADRAGGLAGIAQLVEFEIGEHAGPAPEAGEEEDRGDAGEGEGPPLPVTGHALRAHEVGDQVRRVAGEGGGDHGDAG